MQDFVRGNCTMIAAPVQCDVDGIPKGSHFRAPERVSVLLDRSFFSKRLPKNRTHKFIDAGMTFAPGHDRPLSDSQGELSWRTHECRRGFMSWPDRCCLRKRSLARRVVGARWDTIPY